MTWLQLIPLFALLLSLLLAAIKGIWVLSDLSTKVNLMLTNHLPHLEADIKELRAEFTAFLTNKGR